MTIRFPTDNDPGMSRQNSPRRPGGGKFFFMLIVGVVAFMVMRGMSSQPRTPSESNPIERGGGISGIKYPDLQTDEQLEAMDDRFDGRKQRSDQGDWGMEDGPVQKNAASRKPTTKSSNGDWGLEDVTTKPSAQQPAGRFSQSSNAPAKELQQKQPTKQGDWSLEWPINYLLKFKQS